MYSLIISNQTFPMTTSQPFNATAVNSILGLFGSLAKYFHISPSTLMIICVLILVVVVILLVAIVLRIQKLRETGGKVRKLRKDQDFPLNDADFEKYESPFGYIDMSVMYDKKKKSLKIQHMTIGNIANIGADIPDCYIKIFLKDENGKKIREKKTKTIDDNLNPTFPEVFSFRVEDILTEIIYFQVFDENLNGNDYPMGDGELILNKLPQEQFVGFVYSTYVTLKSPSEVLGCGEVCVILNYSPPEIFITLLEARNLSFQYGDKFHFPSVYGVIKVYVNGRKKKTFKTQSMNNTKNPYIVEKFKLHASYLDLESFVIKVEMHETTAGRISRRIGRLCIGNKMLHPIINDLGEQHIKAVMKQKKKPEAMWHALIKG